VYYGATRVEAQMWAAKTESWSAGENSAGQAAVFLRRTVRRVHIVVRSGGLAESMSRYLIRRNRREPGDYAARPPRKSSGLEGSDRLERVRWRDNTTGTDETETSATVFVMTGAVPNTVWLDGCVALDAKGFIKTGPDLSRDDLATAHWPLTRPPHLLETSLPGVFAVGDVRGGNIKRVASAVGEDRLPSPSSIRCYTTKPRQRAVSFLSP